MISQSEKSVFRGGPSMCNPPVHIQRSSGPEIKDLFINEHVLVKENLNMPNSTRFSGYFGWNSKFRELETVGPHHWLYLKCCRRCRRLPHKSLEISVCHLGFSVKEMKSQTTVKHIPVRQLPGTSNISIQGPPK